MQPYRPLNESAQATASPEEELLHRLRGRRAAVPHAARAGALIGALLSLAVPSQAQMRSATGAYVGNATGGTPITVGFQPDVVIIKGEGAIEAVGTTSMMAVNSTKLMGTGGAAAANLITLLTPNGFTVGTGPQVNNLGILYQWLALQAAPGQLEVGSYVGNAPTDNRLIPTAFQPDWVLVMGLTVGRRAVQRNSSMVGDTTVYLQASGPASDLIQQLLPAGFEVGTGGDVNGGGITYYYVAAKNTAGRFKTGLYAGDFTDNRNITGVGFQPVYAMTKMTTGVQGAAARPASLAGDRSLFFTASPSAPNLIQTLLPDGFQVGSGSQVNANTNSYMWAAFANSAAPVYYSVGTSVADLKAGAPTITITSGAATLSIAQPANVGVGDEITYNGATRAYVSGRISPTQYTVTTATGAVPPDVTGVVVNQIKRAFGSLTAAEANSSNGTHLTTADLVSAQVQLNWACYNDAPMDDQVTISGYATSATDYIRVFTPVSPNQVGTSQRHTGKARTGFRLRPTGGTDRDSIIVNDAFVTIDGLEFDGSLSTAPNGAGGVDIETGAAAPVGHYVSHNIVYETRNFSGIYVNATSAYVWDNVLHRVNNPTLTVGALVMNQAAGTAYFYNNTVYDHAGNGIRNNAGTLVATNNVSMKFGTGTDFSGTITQSYNVSSDATATGTGSQTNKTTYASYFTNVTVGSEDLHLRNNSFALWGSNGTDLTNDANLRVTDDIDGYGRLRPDIGADETVATALYRSVGKNGGAALASGGGTNALTISGSTATFATGLPNNVGVGDVIQYNANGALAFIHGRTSAQSYLVKDKAGNPPAPVAGDTGWSVYRAYLSLANWESQTENTGIVLALRDFDTAGGLNLVATNTTVNVACYADAADTTAVTISGWTTSDANSISIFTPYLPGQVGTSQRHNGVWNAARYQLVAGLPYGAVLLIQEEYVRVAGLQIENTALKGGGGSQRPQGISVDLPTPTSNVRISHNILRNTGGGTGDYLAAAVSQTNAGGTLKAWNNIMYDWGCGVISEFPVASGPSDVALYNNTIINSDNVGIDLVGHTSGTYRVVNNLVQDASGFNYDFGGTVDYSAANLSQDATSPQAALRNKTVTFVGGADFHLSVADTNAKDQGTSLSADAVLAVVDDIDGQLRQAPWDIGADDASGTTAVKLMSFEALGGGRRGGAVVADRLGAGQPGVPRVPRAFRGRPVDAADVVARPGVGLLGGGPELLVPRHGPGERHALLLSAGGRGRVVEGHVSRPRLGGPAGGGHGWQRRVEEGH